MNTAYFSHPSLAYHTRTEEYSISLIKKELGISTVINPFDYRGRRKKELTKQLQTSDVVVGMSVYESYPFIVWHDMDYAASLGKPIYTVTFPTERTTPIELIEGYVEGHEKLGEKETQTLYHGIMKQTSKGIVSRLFLGKLGGRDSVF